MNGTQNPTNPNRLKPEVTPAKRANDIEVDFDKSKTKTYPDNTPPRRH